VCRFLTADQHIKRYLAILVVPNKIPPTTGYLHSL